MGEEADEVPEVVTAQKASGMESTNNQLPNNKRSGHG